METNYIRKHWYTLTIAAITILAVVLRLIHLIQNNSFYGDEVNLLMNVKSLNHKDLISGLNYVQASPPVFLIISKFIYENFKYSSQYTLDLLLRLFPFMCGILSLGLFYKLETKFFESNTKRIIAYLIFAINTQTIAYCAIFKQYTLELTTALILYIIAYDIIFLNKFKWYYSVAILSAIWFSYSSIFILLPFVIYILFKKKNLILKIILPLLISFSAFYELSLKAVFNTTYNDLINCWNNLGFGYISIFHPARTLIRIGEFFIFGATTPHKIATIICGILILYSIIVFILSDRNKTARKIFILTPIILTFTASALHKYPAVARLILFLYPLLTIILTDYEYKLKKLYFTIICIIAISSSLYYVPNLHFPDGNTRNLIEYQKGYLDLTTEEDCIVKYQP